MLPNIFRSRSIEDVLPAQKTPHSTRGTLNFVGTFSRELFTQFLKTSEFNQLHTPLDWYNREETWKTKSRGVRVTSSVKGLTRP